MDKVGRELTRLISMPVKLWGFMCSLSPSQAKGRISSRRTSSAMGKLPSSTTAMEDTVAMASAMGVMPGMGLKPVMDSTAASARLMVTSQRMPSDSRIKPLIILLGIFHSPSSNSTAKAKMGRFWWRHCTTESPLSSPPAARPTGMATSPSMMPLAKKGRSALGIIPMPTGMVNTSVHPKMEATTSPA